LQGRLEEAEATLLQRVRIRKAKLAFDDSRIRLATERLAEVYRLMKRETEAEQILKQFPLS
jgi:hypothetical protein